VNALDEAIELVEVIPLPDHEDTQLLPDGYNESLDQATICINQTEKMDINILATILLVRPWKLESPASKDIIKCKCQKILKA
jgi:hypothetical protein